MSCRSVLLSAAALIALVALPGCQAPLNYEKTDTLELGDIKLYMIDRRETEGQLDLRNRPSPRRKPSARSAPPLACAAGSAAIYDRAPK